MSSLSTHDYSRAEWKKPLHELFDSPRYSARMKRMTMKAKLTKRANKTRTSSGRRLPSRFPSYFYPAIFDPAEEGGYNVSFPAFPGCVTFGATFEEAKKYATEVLELWIEEMRACKRPIPAPHRPIIDEIILPAHASTRR